VEVLTVWQLWYAYFVSKTQRRKDIHMQKRTIGLVAGAAVIIALAGGTAADASGLLTGKDIKDGSLTLKDFKASEKAKLKGATGARGAQGPAGIAGPATASTLDTVTVKSPDTYVSPGQISTVIAYCPAGKKATGGGYFSSVAQAGASVPTGSDTGFPATSWGVIINNDTPIGVRVNAYVICA
jgi:hypothetical protein